MFAAEDYVQDQQRKDKLINEYFNFYISGFRKGFTSVLKSYANLRGNAIDEEYSCYFANEIQEWEEDYFGDRGVMFYFDTPEHNDEDLEIVLVSYEEFYDYLKEACRKYGEKFPQEAKEVNALLKQIKEKLKV